MQKSICTVGVAKQNHNNEQPRSETVYDREGDSKIERERLK